MSHGHHGHGHAHDHTARNIKSAFFLNVFFALVELVGGLLTNSMAIMADALHDLGDSLSLGLAWYFQRLSGKGRNESYSYGYKRFSVLGAIINAIVLTVGSVVVLTEAIPRIFEPQMPHASGMLYLSIGGILINGIAAIRMSHGHSLNERVVYLHLLEDVLGWAATLLVSIVLIFREMPVLDPLLSLFVSLFILYNVARNLKKSFSIILQATPEGIDPNHIEASIKRHPEVRDVHDCHIWTLDGRYHILSIHVVVDEGQSIEQLAKIKQRIKSGLENLRIDHVTLEFETRGETCHSC